MLDREVVKEYISEEFTYLKIDMPDKLDIDSLTETFCRYAEDDLYEWLKDNFKSFFGHSQPDWNRIRKKIEEYSES